MTREQREKEGGEARERGRREGGEGEREGGGGRERQRGNTGVEFPTCHPHIASEKCT